MSTRLLAAALLAIVAVDAHSWLGCSDYRGPVDFYDGTKCYAYPRRWEAARGSALTPQTNGYELGADTGYNYQGSDSAACQFPMSSPVENAYTSKYPMAIYEAGSTYCLAWPTKNHAAATCTNQYIPDTSMQLFVSAINPTSDPTQTDFKTRPVSHLFGTHSNGQIDCLGFQRSPKFCSNTDKALATGCFVVPANMATGRYVFQWYWVFNQGTTAYTTCWDAQVVAAGAGRGAGGLTGASTVADNMNVAGSDSICRTNWATITGSTPTPGAATSTGSASGAPVTPATPTGAPPLSGDSIRVSRAPSQIAQSGTFQVDVDYSASGANHVVVDILRIQGSTVTWYGKGDTAIAAAGTGSLKINITVDAARAPIPASSATSDVVLRAWMVTKSVWDAYVADNSKQPWTEELDRNDSPVVVGSVTVYPAAPVVDNDVDDGAAAAIQSTPIVMLLAAAAAVAGFINRAL